MENNSFGNQNYGGQYQSAPTNNGAYQYGQPISGPQYQEAPVNNENLSSDEQIPGFEFNGNINYAPYEDEIMREEEADRRKPVYIAIAASVAAFVLAGICTFTVVSNHQVTSEPTAVTTQVTAKAVSEMTPGEKQAIRDAQDILNYLHRSRSGVINDLQTDYDHTETEATVAVDYLESQGLVDWNEECLKWAKFIRDGSYYSRQGLIEQLTCDPCGFTEEQAEYAVSYLETNKEIDYFEEAKNEAEYLSSFIDYESKEDLKNSLINTYYFTEEQAAYGVRNINLD